MLDTLSVQQFDKLDPNKPSVQINCICSPSMFVKNHSSFYNVLQLGAYLGKTEAVTAILEIIKEKDLRDVDPENDEASKPLWEVLNCDRKFGEWQHVSPTGIALLSESLEIASLLIRHGGLDTEEIKKKETEDTYKGLDVGGKKMDWVTQRRDNTNKQQCTALHLAAGYDKVNSIQYLLTKAKSDWEVSREGKPKAEIPTAFIPSSPDWNGENALHYAVQGESLGAVKMIIEYDKSLVNVPQTKGFFPIHFAAHLGNLPILQCLLDNGANIESKDTKKWNALHHATAQNKIECVKFLLEKMTPFQVAQSLSRNNQTPLMIAVNHEYIELIELFLKTENKVNIFVIDSYGDTALNHAIKHGKKKIVQLLLKQHEIYRQENAVGLTPTDIAIQKLLLPFPSDRNSDNLTDEEQLGVYNYLAQNITGKRIISKVDEVASVTELILNDVSKKTEEDKETALEKKIKRFDSDSEESDEDSETNIDIKRFEKYYLVPGTELEEFIKIAEAKDNAELEKFKGTPKEKEKEKEDKGKDKKKEKEKKKKGKKL